MNRKQASGYIRMAPEDRNQLLTLKCQLRRLNAFRKHVYYREWFHREAVSTIALGLTIILVLAILIMTVRFVGAWGLAALVFVPFFCLQVLKQFDKCPSWEALFYQKIQDYAPNAVDQSNIQWIKDRVQYSGQLNFGSVREWFDKEFSSIGDSINDIETRYQYAWFYQSSEIKKDTDEPEGLDADTVMSNCASFIEIPSRQNKSQEDPQ